MARAPSTVVPEEVEHFAALAGDWWDPDGASAMLHKLNPVRLAYIRDRIDQHWSLDETGFKPLEGRQALDVGCGAGLLAEPLARLGAKVTAIDAAAELISAAQGHARGQQLEIDYRVAAVEAIDGQFELITALEVIEHVADPAAFLKAIGARLTPDGLVILSTPNRTAWSRLMMITLGEGLGEIPRGTHDFDTFIPPDRMKQLLADSGLKCIDIEGIAWSPTRGLHLSDDVRLNYLVTATRAD
jgi:2-polyprenyl-6-hydroxyphenyl methylase/3-demethylubiquinone-9 3-methyltransferase